MLPSRQWVQVKVTQDWIMACRLETAARGFRTPHSVTLANADIPFLVPLCFSIQKKNNKPICA